MNSLLELPNTLWRLTFVLESRFNEKRALPWMQQYWWMSFVISAIYVILVYGGTKFMENRKPYDLRRLLCMWSTALAAFSTYACIKSLPLLYHLYQQSGFVYTLCDVSYLVGSSGMGIWAFLFPFSKFPELFDTAFIVLRKSKISFLHCYHHISVFIYCWFSYAYPISTGAWFGAVNYFVHAVMYTYFAVKASGRNPPRIVAKMITTLQLSQMFFGIFFNITAIRAVGMGMICQTNWFTVGISWLLYASYAILFGNFYYWTYIHTKQSVSVKPKEKVELRREVTEMQRSTSVSKHSRANGTINGFVTNTPNGIVRHR